MASRKAKVSILTAFLVLTTEGIARLDGLSLIFFYCGFISGLALDVIIVSSFVQASGYWSFRPALRVGYTLDIFHNKDHSKTIHVIWNCCSHVSHGKESSPK